MKKAAGLLLSIALLFVMLPAVSAQSAKYLPYDMVGDLSEGLAWYIEYDEKTDMDKFGYINTSGKVVIPAKYDWASEFNNGLAGVVVNDKWGMIDKTGKLVIQPQFDSLAEEFVDGLAMVVVGDKYGFINEKGQLAIEAKYDDAFPFGDGFAPVSDSDGYYFIDTTGKQAFEGEYVYARNFIDGMASVMVGDKWGFIDNTGKQVVAPKYDSVYAFTDGLAPVLVGDYWGFIDKTGKEVVKPQYEDVFTFSEGYAAVMVNGKWGFIDKTGKVAIKPVYDEVFTEFSEGLALVSKNAGNGDTAQGYIDVTGKERTKFIVDFTGGKFKDGYAVVSDGGFGTYYIMKSPLLAPVSAKPASSKVLVNGKAVAFEAYNINGSNYFKLRDLALAVNGTDKNFEVSWDSSKNAINLLSGKAYTPVGGELAAAAVATAQKATPTVSKIYVDGVEAKLQAYNIGGNNYFKLRDIAKAFNIGVTWDAATSSIGIDTKLSYTE